jgi:sodium transport system permease protein
VASGEAGRESESRDNGTPMGQPGSKPTAADLAAGFVGALLLSAAGVAGMYGAAAGAARLGLGLRTQVAIATVLFALPVAAALALVPRVRSTVLGTLAPGRRVVLLSVLLGAALWVASIGLVELQALVRPPSEEELDVFRRLHAALAPSGVVDALASLAVIAVLPAVCEELVMRGALLAAFVSVAGAIASAALRPPSANFVVRAVSVVATAVLFALIHDPVRWLFAFALGVALGALRLRTRSLVPPVLTHATLNAITFAVAPLVDDPSQPYEPRPALGLACLVVGLALAWPLLRALRQGPAPDPTTV